MNSSTSNFSVRTAFKFTIRLVLFGVSLFVVLELFFRFVLMADEYPRVVQDEVYMVSRYDSTWVTEGIRTHGQYCKEQGHWRINNAGWNSIFDYTPRTNFERPRIAIIGDSFIEGWALDVEDHVDAVLYRLLNGTADVYAFGVSGVNIAQQVGMIRYIEEEFDPEIYCILVDHYPPEKSLLCTNPYRFTVKEDSTGYFLKPPIQVFHQNNFGRIVFRSAFARYLKLNKQILINDIQDLPNEQESDISSDEEIDEIFSERDVAIISFSVDTLIRIIPEDEIIFFCDVRRTAIYSGEENIQPVDNFLLLEIIQQDYPYYHLVDLTPAFIQDYERNGIRFEASNEDYHWNECAHSVAANALFEIIKEIIYQ